MPKYSVERKESVLSKLLGSHRYSIAEIAREEGISEQIQRQAALIDADLDAGRQKLLFAMSLLPDGQPILRLSKNSLFNLDDVADLKNKMGNFVHDLFSKSFSLDPSTAYKDLIVRLNTFNNLHLLNNGGGRVYSLLLQYFSFDEGWPPTVFNSHLSHYTNTIDGIDSISRQYITANLNQGKRAVRDYGNYMSWMELGSPCRFFDFPLDGTNLN